MATDKSKEAMKLALNKAFQLGQRYWSWADSEYSSHWKKADAAKAEFDKLVENTYEAIANDPENPVQIDPSAETQVSKVWWDGDKLMAKPIPLESIYKEPEKPAQQTIHCKHRLENNGVCPHHNLQCGWPKCNEPEQPAQHEPVAYGMWDTMLGKGNRMMMVRLDRGQDGCTVPLYASPPAQRKPLTDEEIEEINVSLTGRRDLARMFARAVEAKLKERNT